MNILTEDQKNRIMTAPSEVKMDTFMEILNCCDGTIFETLKFMFKSLCPDVWQDLLFLYHSDPELMRPKKKRRGKVQVKKAQDPNHCPTSSSANIATGRVPSNEVQSHSLSHLTEGNTLQTPSSASIVQLLDETMDIPQVLVTNKEGVECESSTPPSFQASTPPQQGCTPLLPEPEINQVVPLDIIRSAIMQPITARNMMCKMKLGMGCFVTAGVWPARHQLRINIRQFDGCGKLPLSKKGASLTLSRWVILKNLRERIDDVLCTNRRALAIPNPEDTSQIDAVIPKSLWEHLGGNVYVQINTGGTHLDLRRWWHPHPCAELTPTRTGIILNYDQWRNLKHCFTLMPEIIPEVETVIPCFQSHSSEELLIQCLECNPPKMGMNLVNNF